MKKEYSQANKTIVLKERCKISLVKVEHITHIYSDAYLVVVHLDEEDIKYRVTDTLDRFENSLNNCGFFRISRNCIVNLAHVTSYSTINRKLTLHNKVEVCVARSRCKTLRDYFLNVAG